MRFWLVDNTTMVACPWIHINLSHHDIFLSTTAAVPQLKCSNHHPSLSDKDMWAGAAQIFPLLLVLMVSQPLSTTTRLQTPTFTDLLSLLHPTTGLLTLQPSSGMKLPISLAAIHQQTYEDTAGHRTYLPCQRSPIISTLYPHTLLTSERVPSLPIAPLPIERLRTAPTQAQITNQMRPTTNTSATTSLPTK